VAFARVQSRRPGRRPAACSTALRRNCRRSTRKIGHARRDSKMLVSVVSPRKRSSWPENGIRGRNGRIVGNASQSDKEKNVLSDGGRELFRSPLRTRAKWSRFHGSANPASSSDAGCGSFDLIAGMTSALAPHGILREGQSTVFTAWP
jgi:hypothetical protein